MALTPPDITEHVAEVDFHFDLMCPWAYQTSKWIRSVREQNGVTVNWRFFSLEEINLRPGNFHNFLNPDSMEKIPVAVLTTDSGEYGLPLDFDATAIDAPTALFGTVEELDAGGGSSAAPSKGLIKDAHELDDKTKDGDADMVMLFPILGSGVGEPTTEACVTGSYLGADENTYTFFGCDVVVVMP